jgi:hypothetical protein
VSWSVNEAEAHRLTSVDAVQTSATEAMTSPPSKALIIADRQHHRQLMNCSADADIYAVDRIGKAQSSAVTCNPNADLADFFSEDVSSIALSQASF